MANYKFKVGETVRLVNVDGILSLSGLIPGAFMDTFLDAKWQVIAHVVKTPKVPFTYTLRAYLGKTWYIEVHANRSNMAKAQKETT